MFHDLTDDQVEWWIQFTHPEKTLAALPGAREAVTVSFLAGAFGLDPETYGAMRSRFAENVDHVARDLLTDPVMANAVDHLPFDRGSRVVAFGDSMTDDYQSWAEILDRLLQLRRREDSIRIINAGVSGDTTATGLARFVDVARESPSHIICLLGTNDARVHREFPTKCLVSSEESRRNFLALRATARRSTDAQLIWMTPPPAIEQRVTEHWYLSHFQMLWRNVDLETVAGIVRQLDDHVIDLWPLFDDLKRPELLLDDGLHPSLEGQRAIVTALVTGLGSTTDGA